MANAINDEILTNVKALISKITDYEVGSEKFINLEKCIITTLKRSDTMYFLNTKDIRKAVWSMAEKFMFHGCFKHADYLKILHDKYIDENLSESDLTPRLNIVKFLLCMSQNPTNQFWKYPEKFNFIQDSADQQDVIDWGAYLNEGIEPWVLPKDDSSQESSDSEDQTDSTTLLHDSCTFPIVITESQDLQQYDFQSCRSDLVEKIQGDWFCGESVCMEPPSDWFNAQVGILYEQHLKNQTKSLVKIDPVSVISEYKVMREILWQMWGLHNSTIFRLNLNKLVPKENVTISSVCSMTFERFLDAFVPYIETLDEFRQFYKLLEHPNTCETYKSYGCVLKKITKSVFEKLVEIEREIREQETTMTLLKFANKLEKIFEPVKILKNVHIEVIPENFQNVTSLECALTLLTRLRNSLPFSINKLEQDIRLTLYLESLYYYFTMVNAWLVKNDLYDHTEEFIILNKNDNLKLQNVKYQMNFKLQDKVDIFCQEDGIIRIISEQVLQIGRNIHLLRLLGKYDVFAKGRETIYQEFIRRFLEELSIYYGCDIPESVPEELKVVKAKSSFEINEMGDWTSFVDLSDGFLAKAFDDFYLETVKPVADDTLFEKINKITTNLFPLQSLPEKIFTQILKDRFTISGLMVKSLLIENYYLDKQFEFLNDIFLFWNDTIFAFYRRLFEKMNIANSNWGNSVWLTSHLQDLIMDSYPNFYEDCTIQVKDHWKQCRDSLEACTLITIKYEIKWPLNLIITEEHISMYAEIFQFVLKIKWALYTINHLSFTDLEPKKKGGRASASPTTIKRLKYLRFNLINILNTVQHYLFGFVLTKNRIQFAIGFEKSNDLKSLITSHEDFVEAVHCVAAGLRDKESNSYGFNTLLKSVKMLKVMWNQVEFATLENLDACHKIFKASFKVVDGLVNPVFV